MEQKVGRQVSSTGEVIYTGTPVHATDALPHLKPVDTISALAEAVDPKNGNKNVLVPHQQAVYMQKSKNEIEKALINDAIFDQMAAWFEHPKRASFIKDLYIQAYDKLNKKPMQLLLVDSQDRSSIIPKVRLIRPSHFQKLEKILGKQIRALAYLPDVLENNWFPILLMHRHIFPKGYTSTTPAEAKEAQALQTITYLSCTMMSYPDATEHWKSWSEERIQDFAVNFLRSQDEVAMGVDSVKKVNE